VSVVRACVRAMLRYVRGVFCSTPGTETPAPGSLSRKIVCFRSGLAASKVASLRPRRVKCTFSFPGILRQNMLLRYYFTRSKIFRSTIFCLKIQLYSCS
jgi:hypothetical protein